MVSITRKGYIELYYGDSLLSRHTAVEEAYERALVHLEENQATEGYTGLYRVKYPDREIDVTSILEKTFVRKVPEAVSGLILSAVGPQNVTLSWNAAVGAETYNVIRGTATSGITNNDGKVIANVAALTYDDETMFSEGQQYYWRVCPKNAAGVGICSDRVLETPAPAASEGATITVASTGADYTTINAALAAAGPGDVVELRAATPGGTETWAQRLQASNVTGTAANPIQVRVRDGDTIILKTSTPTDTGLVEITNCAYLFIQGNSTGRDGLQFGNMNDWVYQSSGSQTHYPYSLNILMVGSSWIWLKNLKFTGASRWYASDIRRSCTNIRMTNVEGGWSGNNNWLNTSTDKWEDNQDLLRNNARGCLFEDCFFHHGGHNCLTVQGYKQVYRGCTMDGNWQGAGTGKPGQRAYQCFCTARGTWHADDQSIDPWIFGPNLIDGSIIKNADATGDDAVPALIQWMSVGYIVRGSLMHDGSGLLERQIAWGAESYNHPDTQVSGNMSIYNNVVYNTHSTYQANGDHYQYNNYTRSPWEWSNYLIRNNLFQAIDNGVMGSGPTTNALIWSMNNIPTTGYADAWKHTVISHNVWGGPGDMRVRFMSTSGSVTTRSLDDSSTWPANFFSNTIYNVPFVNAAARTFEGFAIDPSSAQGIGDAVALTTVTTGGTNVTQITVANPRPFYDGWGMQYWGEHGDYIAIGNDIRQIADNGINYTTGVIQLTSPVTCSAGTGVWFAGNHKSTPAKWVNKGVAQ